MITDIYCSLLTILFIILDIVLKYNYILILFLTNLITIFDFKFDYVSEKPQVDTQTMIIGLLLFLFEIGIRTFFWQHSTWRLSNTVMILDG